MKPKIWQRYLFFEMVKNLLFFLLVSFIIYGVMKFSFQSRHIFSQDHFNLFKIFQFYGQNFLLELEIFLPLSFLLALIKVICTLNSHNELVVFHMAGLSMKDLLKPIFFLASICAALTFFNTELIIPSSISSNQKIKAQHIHAPKKNKKEYFLNVKLLTDSSKIIYLQETSPHEFFDVYWICNNTEIWHMKELSFTKEKKEGRWIDHFIYQEGSGFQKKDSYNTLMFTQMANELPDRIKSPIPTENKSITSLLKQLIFSHYSSSREKAQANTYLNYKLAMPFFPFIIILAISPFCFRFSRHLPTFAIFVISLLGFIIFYMVIDAMIIFSENLVIPPFVAIWSPFVITTFVVGLHFYKNLKTLS